MKVQKFKYVKGYFKNVTITLKCIKLAKQAKDMLFLAKFNHNYDQDVIFTGADIQYLLSSGNIKKLD